MANLTHEQMVQEALGNQEITTNGEVQEYIRDFLGVTISTGEISDIRNANEEPAWIKAINDRSEPRVSQAERPFWYQDPKVDPWTDPYWR